MTKQEAHSLLDLACAGGRVSESQITAALAATGDLGRPAATVAVAVEASREWPYYASPARVEMGVRV